MKHSKYLICIDNSKFAASLVAGKIFESTPDKDASELGQLRAIDESGKDDLYPE